MLKPAMNKYCFVGRTSFSDLEDEYDLKTGSVLTNKINLVLADSLYNTRSALCQSKSAHEGFSKRELENAVRLMSNVLFSGVHGNLLCSDLMQIIGTRAFERQRRR